MPSAARRAALRNVCVRMQIPVERLVFSELSYSDPESPDLDSNDWRNTLHDGLLEGHGFAQVTAPPSRFRSFPAWMPVGSLDKAYTRGGVRIRSSHVVRTRLTRVASDHLPLLVDFHLDAGSIPGEA